MTIRQAGEILYSVVMHCAIALGDIVINQRLVYQWGLDLDPENCEDQMASARRVVYLSPGQSTCD